MISSNGSRKSCHPAGQAQVSKGGFPLTRRNEDGLYVKKNQFSPSALRRNWSGLTTMYEASIQIFVDITLHRISAYVELLTLQLKHEFSGELIRNN